MSLWHKTRTTLEMIKWEHSIFALPFALTGAMLAASGWPHPMQLFWIVICMVLARSAGMAFNRWADSTLDAANPRTATRAIPAVSSPAASSAGSRSSAPRSSSSRPPSSTASPCCSRPWHSPSCSSTPTPNASPAGRTSFSASPSASPPSAAWIAIRGALDPRIVVLTGIVLCWVGGFDMLYACQDFDHDRGAGLRSLPAAIGIAGAFRTARILHLLMLALSAWLIHLFALGPIAWVGIAIVALLLAYEHSIISPTDLTRMNAAFFTLNGYISIVFFVFISTDLLHRR